MDKKWVWGLVIIIVVAIGVIILVNKTAPASKNTNSATESPTPTNNATPTQAASPTVNQSNYFFPLPNYFSRILVRKYGQLVSPSDRPNIPCGAEFSGYHDGDDLETTAAEQNQDVPVYAAAEGKVVLLEHVSGYGGLLVEASSLPLSAGPTSAKATAGEEVTIYYGHISLASAKVRQGEAVKSGQILANLGRGCSSQTDGERKHLHFAIHLGSSVDVRGYAPTREALSQWLNPAEGLKSLSANEPGKN